jgi:hypothetical protein
MPARVQRSRRKGWHLADATTNPLGAVIVSRPSRYGNPYKVSLLQEMGYHDPHAAAADNYMHWLGGSRSDAPTDEADLRRERILRNLPALRGRDLACTCRLDQRCHADTLLFRANMPAADQAAWIDRVRHRVDAFRAQWGEPPLADLPELPAWWHREAP